MFAQARSRVNPYRLYIGIEVAESFLVAMAYTTSVVYFVRSGHLNPLQLILLGTMVEVAYFALQLPAGILADLVSRRLCVIAGRFLCAGGFLMQGLSPHFAVLLIAQIPVGFGAALSVGAQEAWLADEAGDTELTSVFLRATQFGLASGLAGSVLSGILALSGLQVPFLVSGGLLGVLAIVLTCVMPEAGFRPRSRAPRLRGVLAQAWGQFAGQVRKTHRAMVVVPGLVLLLGMTFFLGMWGESFDRLWGAYLLHDIRFPRILGLDTVLWFSVFAVASALLSLGSTEWAKRRTARLGPASVVKTLLALTIATALAVVVMAADRAFVIVIIGYLAVTTMRPVFSPLVTGWVISRVDSGVRASALSAAELFDSGGQIAGGPAVGVIGVLASIRVALLAGAIALGPAVGCLAAATWRVRARGSAAGPLEPGGSDEPDGAGPDGANGTNVMDGAGPDVADGADGAGGAGYDGTRRARS